ncbi:hypothetical protein B0H21DRAFT_153401 [Amylocystis lapponica]|nr:hypothetical protein B0H21DRAFT_153401 [Amylocystis lapponica]
MLHLYDSSIYCAEAQDTRLRPARAVTDANIPCLVWAEDALAFVHCVPTVLFAFQLIVPDEHVQAAATAITSHLPYQQMTDPHPHWLDYKHMDAAEPSCFPSSVLLQHTSPADRVEYDPEDIYVHPQSYFSFDVRDPSLSVSLVPPLPPRNASIRFPTLVAFMDSLIATQLDPPLGFRHLKFSQRLKVYFGYLMLYSPVLHAMPRELFNGELEPGHAKVMDSLKAENRHFFYTFARVITKGWDDEVQERRTTLEKMGRFAEARKPLPVFRRGPSK